MTRTRIALLDDAQHVGGVTRYGQALLDHIDPNEFDILFLGHPKHPFRLPRHVTFVPLPVEAADEVSSAPPSPGDAGSQRKKAGLRTVWRSPVFRYPRFYVGLVAEARSLARYLKTAIREYRIDILHTQIDGLGHIDNIAAHWAQVPKVVSTIHVNPNIDLVAKSRRIFGQPLEKSLHGRVSHLIAVSESTRRDWIKSFGFSANHIQTIHNGTSTWDVIGSFDKNEAKRRLGIMLRDRTLIGGVGRLHDQKGFKFLIQAIRLLLDRGADCELVICGDGPKRGELQNQINELGIAGRVMLAGHKQSLSDFYRAIDVCALPSLTECLPFAVLDAMKYGLPVVAARVGGIPEVVVEEETGAICEPGNAHDLAEKLWPYVSHSSLCAQHGEAGKDE